MQPIDRVLFEALTHPAWLMPDSSISALLQLNDVEPSRVSSLQIIKLTNNGQELVDHLKNQPALGFFYYFRKLLWVWSDVKITIDVAIKNNMIFDSRAPQLSFSDIRLLTRLCMLSKVGNDREDERSDELALLPRWSRSIAISAQERQQLFMLTIDGIDSDKTLRRTTQAIFDCNLSVAKTAHRLGVHRNTLVYRLNRIKKLTNIDLTDFYQAKSYYQCWLIKKIEIG